MSHLQTGSGITWGQRCRPRPSARDWRINNDNRTEFDLRVFCHLNRLCSCVNWFSRASPKGFFNICNFGVKTIEASSPFKYFPIEYTKNCKIDSLILGHRRELRPDILSRLQFQ